MATAAEKRRKKVKNRKRVQRRKKAASARGRHVTARVAVEQPRRGKRPKPPARPPVQNLIVPRDPENLAAHPLPGHTFMDVLPVFLEPPVYSSLETPDYIPPDPAALLPDGVTPKFFETAREFDQAKRLMVNEFGQQEMVDFWGFYDPATVGVPPKGNEKYLFPSDPIRMVEGQYFHCVSTMHKHSHTIHWHGMEPTAHNDGVGKLSMEVGGTYTYQWWASAAGTYFYHCHRNTPLHFEYGMYGMLLIDPMNPETYMIAKGQWPGYSRPDIGNPPYPIGGKGWVRYKDPSTDTEAAALGVPPGFRPYDKEVIWVLDDVDPRWHALGHGYAMAVPDPLLTQPNDVNGNPLGAIYAAGDLHVFAPKYFCISGIPHPWTRDGLPPNVAALDNLAQLLPPVIANVRVGETLLVRLVCGAYSLDNCRIDIDAEVIAMDGRTMGRHPHNQYSRPFVIPARTEFELTAARRFDLLIRPTQPGEYLAHFDFLHHVEKSSLTRPMGIAETKIIVQP